MYVLINILKGVNIKDNRLKIKRITKSANNWFDKGQKPGKECQ